MDSETLGFFQNELNKRYDDEWYIWESQNQNQYFHVKYEKDTLVVEPINFVDDKSGDSDDEYYEGSEYTQEEKGIYLSKIIHYILNCISSETKVKINGMKIRHFYFKSDFVRFEHCKSINKLYPKWTENVYENYRIKINNDYHTICDFKDTNHLQELKEYDLKLQNKKDKEYWMSNTIDLLKKGIIDKTDIDTLYEHLKN